MISSLDFTAYRKLKNIKIGFNSKINIIAGTNGTGKSSILHIISNSFQSVVKTDPFVKDSNALDVINRMNKLANPKIETLTRGDKDYNDPAIGTKGALYKCNYKDGYSLSFRRHNSDNKNLKRFSVKPNYAKNSNDSLPKLPIIYLGLFRLFSYGEFYEDNLIKDIATKLPDKYLEILGDHYFDFTGQRIEFDNFKNMGDIKNRANFTTEQEGIDSNTISAGEDNLFIILFALVTLRYYFDSIDSTKEVESILLIDELDASLHPAFQLELIDLFIEYASDYKIQFVATSHSMSLLEHVLNNPKHCKAIYLLDEIHKVREMQDPDIHKINMWLKNQTRSEIYLENKIPIISEDDEARFFLDLLFNHYETLTGINLNHFFHKVKANLSSEAIRNLVNDDFLLRTTLRGVFILDGDQNGQTDYNKNLITLPGDDSPEKIVFDHAEDLFKDEETEFWENDVLDNSGMTKLNFRSDILPEIKMIEQDIEDAQSTKGLRRTLNKKLFNKYNTFWKFVLKDWIENPKNLKSINKFFRSLNIVFKRSSEFHGIDSKQWDFIDVDYD